MEKGQTPPGGEWEKAQGEFRLVEEIITPNPETAPGGSETAKSPPLLVLSL